MDTWQVEPDGAGDNGLCDCCGHMSRCVWGFIRSPTEVVAAYFVHWTLGRVVEHGANFDLIIGRWGPGAEAVDRSLVALAYRLMEGGPAFMVIEAADRPAAGNALVGRSLRRSEVIGRPVATQAFSLVDAILAQDDRIAELLGRT